MKSEELFFKSEALGTAVDPQCGACRCTKCPVPGSKYSYSEQKALEMIQKNLRYDAAHRRYYTVYPWLVPRSTLPKNDKIAYQSLMALERNLSRNPELAKEFCEQVDDMVKRGAAVILTEAQLNSDWSEGGRNGCEGAAMRHDTKDKKLFQNILNFLREGTSPHRPARGG